MFYATCPMACPTLISDLQRLEAELGEAERDDLRVLLVSLDPETDDTAKLREVVERHELDEARWTLAAPDADQVRDLAAVLGSALAGIDAGLEPPPPITGNAYAQKLPQIPGSLGDALGHLEASAMARDIFPPALVDNFIATKRQEMAVLGDKSEDALLAVYLDRA